MRDRITDARGAEAGRRVRPRRPPLRRLERDIHDGPQQRLVRLAMDLGRARQQLATDPEAARPDHRRGGHPDPGDARRAARAVPGHRPADPGRPRPAQRAGRARRPRPGPGRAGSTRAGHPGRAARPGGGEHRVLRGGRGADQRRQAQPGQRVPGRASTRPGDRLQVTRRATTGWAARTWPRGTGWPASPTGSGPPAATRGDQPGRRPDRDPRRAAPVSRRRPRPVPIRRPAGRGRHRPCGS